jgi:hypothetical protein
VASFPNHDRALGCSPGSAAVGHHSARANSSTSKHSITSPVWMSW